MENTATESRVNQRSLLSDLLIWRTPSLAGFTRAFHTFAAWRHRSEQKQKTRRNNNMSTIAKKKPRVRRLAPEGMHVARCMRVIDLGTQRGELEREKENKPAGNSRVGVTGVPNRVQRRPWRGTVCCIKVVQQFVAREDRDLFRDLVSWIGRGFTREAEFSSERSWGNRVCLISFTRSR